MIAAGSRFARSVIAGVGLAVLAVSFTSPAEAGGLWWPHPHGHGFVTTRTVGSPVVGTSSVLVPMAVTGTTVVGASNVAASSNALVPMSVGTASLTNQVFTASVPVQYTLTTGASSAVQPIAGAGTAASSTAPALFPASLSPASVATLAPASVGLASSSGDYLAEYNAFVVNERAVFPAGVTLAPADLQNFGGIFGSLSGAVGGPERLGSIGRFLKTKISDPNFRAKGLNLIARVIEVTNPGLVPVIEGFRPVISTFLEILQGNGGKGTATESPATSDPIIGGNGGLPIKDGVLQVRVTFDNSPPGTSAGGKTEERKTDAKVPVTTMKGLLEQMEAKSATLDTDGGMTVDTKDGRKVKFDRDGRLVVKP